MLLVLLLTFCGCTGSQENASNNIGNPINIDPKGVMDGLNCEQISGWACDPNDYTKQLEVYFYVDGPANVGKFLGSYTANKPRENAVAAECGGYANHGFVFITPDSLKDGASHMVYAYAVNTPAGDNLKLSAATNVIQCAKGETKTELSPSPFTQEIRIENNVADLKDYTLKLVLDDSQVGDHWNWSKKGADLAFLNSEQKEIPFYVESWDTQAKEAIVWIRVPDLVKGENSVFLQYGGNTIGKSDGKATFIYFDDFSDETGDWTAYNGQWQIQDGAYDQATDSGGSGNVFYTIGGESLKDYTLEARFYTDSSVAPSSFNVGLIYRFKDASNFYRILCHPGSSTGYFAVARKLNGADSRIVNGVSMPMIPQKGNWYTFKVVVSGNKQSAYINDQYITEWTDPAIPSGYIGLVLENARGRFDNVKQYNVDLNLPYEIMK